MTELQEQEIRDYLLSKNLSFDILLEVEDHFFSQILDLQRINNNSFTEAFISTKNKWKNDLSAYYPFYILKKTSAALKTPFEQKIRKNANIHLLKLSIGIAAVTFLLLYMGIAFFNTSEFKILFRTIMCMVAGFAFVSFFYNLVFNGFAFKKVHNNYKFSIYQWTFPLVFSLGYFGIQYIGSLTSLVSLFYSKSLDLIIISKLFVLVLLVVSYIFTGLSQIKLAQTFIKIQPYLKIS